MTDEPATENQISDGNSVFDLIGVILSAVVLTAISIVVSGKFIAHSVPHMSGNDDYFMIGYKILKIEARGSEVAWGFAAFIVCMGFTVFFGGKPAHEFFSQQTGLEIGQWSSLSAIAGFISVICSMILFIISPLIKSKPLLSTEERRRQIEKLKESDTTLEDDNDE